MDPVSASVSNPVKAPELPYDKLAFGITINTTIEPITGIMRASGNYTVMRGRKFEDGTWEIDPHISAEGKPPCVSAGVDDWFALMTDMAAAGHMEVYNAFVALGAAIGKVNEVQGNV